jgi:glutamate--cysteine ligase catalytic subunit
VWGDEIEVMLVGRQSSGYRLVLGSEALVDSLNGLGHEAMSFSIEFAGFMVETTPKTPHNSSFESLLNVEKSMADRINILKKGVGSIVPRGFPLLMTCFPSIGHGRSFYDEEPSDFEVKCLCEKRDDCKCVNDRVWERGKSLTYNDTRSYFFPDNAITRHNRFFSFVKNIINRRKKLVEGYIKIMEDDKTEAKGIIPDLFTPNKHAPKKEIDGVLIDSMGQGMGCCCLQLTLQASEMKGGRTIYDMLGVLCPLLLRMTRATPIGQGRLLETETRWDMLVFSVDCRTDEERGSKYDRSGYDDKPSSDSKIKKSRFSSIDMFISEDEMNLKDYNDLELPLHEESYKRLVDGDVDELMARHVSSLFIRDPILVYEDTLERIGNKGSIFSTDEFENIQSSNWRSMRFKLPSPSGKKGEDGWKVEVRPMEIQPTPFENAAFCIFVVLLSRAIILYRLNLYIPLSLVDENFRRANMLRRRKEEYFSPLEEDKAIFYYRKNIFDKGVPEISEGTIREIFLGDEKYVGLIPLVTRFVRERSDGGEDLMKYINFIEKKCTNEYISVSDWIRRFVITHKEYMNDSVVNEKIVNDLIEELGNIGEKNDASYLANN